MIDLAIKIATEPAPPLDALCADAPAGLGEVVARCLEKDRERRFQSVGELAVALESFGSNRARASVERVLGTLRKAGRRDDPPVERPRSISTSPEASSLQGAQAGRRAIATITETVPALHRTTAPASIPSANAASGEGSNAASSRRGGVVKTIAALTGGVGLLAVLVSFGLPLVKHERETPDARAQAVDLPPPSASGSQLAPVAPPESAAVVASVVATASPPAAASTNGAPARATATAPDRGPARRPAPRAVPLARPASTTACDPPYTIDERGHRVPKPECL